MNRITTIIAPIERPKRQAGDNDFYAIQRAKLILEEVAAKHRLAADDLKKRTRKRRIAWPRQEYMFRAAEARVSLTTIARVVGLTDHTTIAHGIRQHALRLKEEANNGTHQND